MLNIVDGCKLISSTGASAAPPEPTSDFKSKYPTDPLGKEMEPSARVWKVYLEHATAHDKAMLEGWNNTLDILLIFVRHESHNQRPLN